MVIRAPQSCDGRHEEESVANMLHSGRLAQDHNITEFETEWVSLLRSSNQKRGSELMGLSPKSYVAEHVSENFRVRQCKASNCRTFQTTKRSNIAAPVFGTPAAITTMN
jgi:hypothetical protein